MWNTVTWIFNGIGILLLVQFIQFKYSDYKALVDQTQFWKAERHKYILSVGLVLAVTLLLAEVFYQLIATTKRNEQAAIWTLSGYCYCAWD